MYQTWFLWSTQVCFQNSISISLADLMFLLLKTYLTATELVCAIMPYGFTLYYLPPSRGDILVFTPAS